MIATGETPVVPVSRQDGGPVLRDLTVTDGAGTHLYGNISQGTLMIFR